MSSEHVDLVALAPSWKLSLQADRRADTTIESYLTGLRLFLDWCATRGEEPRLERNLVRAWITHLLSQGASPNTARARQMALKRYSAWLCEENEIDADPLRDLKPPKLDTKVIDRYTDDECVRLITACQGKRFIDRRDESIARLLVFSGLRARELLALTVDDLDLTTGTAAIQRGKGGKGRIVPFPPDVGRSLDRYRRMRHSHRLAHTGKMFLGDNGQNFGYHALDRTMKRRAEAAGLSGFHLHRLRNTAASRWLAAGGSENGLMAIAGWSSREMLDRYTQASAADRAAAEARRLDLNLGI